MVVAERMAELVHPQQPPRTLRPIEVLVEQNRRSGNHPIRLRCPPPEANRVELTAHAAIPADDDMVRSRDASKITWSRLLDRDRRKSLEPVSGEQTERLCQVIDQLIDLFASKHISGCRILRSLAGVIL